MGQKQKWKWIFDSWFHFCFHIVWTSRRTEIFQLISPRTDSRGKCILCFIHFTITTNDKQLYVCYKLYTNVKETVQIMLDQCCVQEKYQWDEEETHVDYDQKKNVPHTFFFLFKRLVCKMTQYFNCTKQSVEVCQGQKDWYLVSDISKKIKWWLERLLDFRGEQLQSLLYECVRMGNPGGVVVQIQIITMWHVATEWTAPRNNEALKLKHFWL